MATKMLCILIAIFAIVILALNIALSFVNGVAAEFMSGMVYGIASSAFLAMALIMVPIIQRLRTRMNELIDEIQIKG
jgi:preprotein translocase subunit SecF